LTLIRRLSLLRGLCGLGPGRVSQFRGEFVTA
jgi:hypothetical protein